MSKGPGLETVKWDEEQEARRKAAGVTKSELRWFVCHYGRHRYRSHANLSGLCPKCKSVGVLEGYVP